MKHTDHKKLVSYIKLSVTLLAECFSLFSIIFFIIREDRVPIVMMCLLTVALSALPFLFEKAFKISFSIPFYIYATVYALGPMLGYSYRLYLLTDWWDKFLHFSGGYFFAEVGYYLSLIALEEDRKKARIISAIFGSALQLPYQFYGNSLNLDLTSFSAWTCRMILI